MWAGHNRSPAWWAWWSNYFKGWGSKQASEQEAMGVLIDLTTAMNVEEAQLLKYQAYLADGLSWASVAINNTTSTIAAIKNAITEKLKEYQSEGLNITLPQ